MKLSQLAADVASSTRAAVREWTAEHGRERGLSLFARKIGITERRARSLLEGTAGRIDAAEYIAAQKARAEILRQRIGRAQATLKEIEAVDGMDLGSRGRGPAADGGVGDRRDGLARAGGAMVPPPGQRSARPAGSPALIPGLFTTP